MLFTPNLLHQGKATATCVGFFYHARKKTGIPKHRRTDPILLSAGTQLIHGSPHLTGVSISRKTTSLHVKQAIRKPTSDAQEEASQNL